MTSNDKDTTIIGISDTMWTENTLNATFKSGQYVYRSTAPVRANSPATGFAVTRGRHDTLTSVSVAFDDATVVGQVVGAQIYHFDAASTTWMYDGVTKFRALTAADISVGEVVWANFRVDEVATGGHIILDGGTDGVTYAAVVKGQSNTADVVVLSTTPPAAYAAIGYAAFSDTSYNDGSASQQFGQTGLPYGNATVPLIALNFGVVPTGINDVNMPNVIVGKAMPNPANTQVSIPVTVSRDGAMTVTLSNMLGQTVSTQNLNTKAGQQAKATFATANLPAGIYMYTVSVDGSNVTGRVVVAH